MSVDACLKKAFIIHGKYYDFATRRVLAGGVQTYISNILPLLSAAGYACTVYQFEEGDTGEEAMLADCRVRSVPRSILKGNQETSVILSEVEKDFDKENDLLIFADHILTAKNDAKHSLSIQHGIHWDVKKDVSRKELHMFLSKARFARAMHRQMTYVKEVVCVDYNFLNWYRAQVDIPNSNFTVIPNFTRIAPIFDKPRDTVNIIFARRFFPHRGTRVFAEAISRILEEYAHVHVTVAGRGPDEAFLHDALDRYSEKVRFTQYAAEESLSIHADQHIAVVPTVGSEGTSLSLLEAMSAQCAVICTDVGGMTNIVLNDYNGSMVSAGSSEALYLAMKRLIESPKDLQRLADKGYETVQAAFSYERWKRQWEEVIARNA